MAILGLTGEPVRPSWHRNLEPGAFTRSAVFGDCYAGDRKDLTGKEKTKTGVLPEAPGEEFLFVFCGDPHTVVLADNTESHIDLLQRDPDGLHICTAIAEGVIDLDQTATVSFARLSQSGLAMNIVIDTQLHTIPMRSLTQVLTGHNRKAPLFRAG